MTELITVILEIIWASFIMAFWIALATIIVCACIQTVRNGRRAIKARFGK